MHRDVLFGLSVHFQQALDHRSLVIDWHDKVAHASQVHLLVQRDALGAWLEHACSLAGRIAGDELIDEDEIPHALVADDKPCLPALEGRDIESSGAEFLVADATSKELEFTVNLKL